MSKKYRNDDDYGDWLHERRKDQQLEEQEFPFTERDALSEEDIDHE